MKCSRLFIFALVLFFLCEVRSEGDFLGKYTWDGEGYVSKPERTLVPHHPSDNSGVTIGRGYDMKSRTAKQIIRELTRAGVSEEVAERFSECAGKSSEDADELVGRLRAEGVGITYEQERNLFDQTYAWYFQNVKEVTQRHAHEYGDLDMSQVPNGVWEFLTDLHYQGKYGEKTRDSLMPALIDSAQDGVWSNFWNATQKWNNNDLKLSGERRKDLRDQLIAEKQKIQSCPFGKYFHFLSGTCEKCSPGTYSRGGELLTCFKCPAKTYSKEGWGGCVACPWGTFLFEGKSCKKCPRGTYNAIDGSSECLPCPYGKTSCEGAIECFPPSIIARIGGCSS